ncbi:MAG: DUF1592 domain-containing protein [Sandaracinaceae bacterium]|nr:DUF1592 domain-containing protein [Sandaracinaceae bacterium]
MRVFLPSLALLLVACQGFVGDTPVRPGDRNDLPEGVVLPAPQTRLARLTHSQWERTTQDLFGLDEPTGLGTSFRADSLPGDAVFDNPGAALDVDEVLWNGYQRAAGALAERATSDAAILARVAPDTGGAVEDQAERFVRDFGARAHRRPLTDDEVGEYLHVYATAAGLFGPLDAHTAGVRLVLEAMLQSPWFLYRVETSRDPDGRIIPLDGWEVASRLSYALWGSMPDEELFAAAAAGMLTTPDGVVTQARRMLDDPRAEATVVDFHRQLFDVRKFEGIVPSPDVFGDVSPRLAEFATREHDLFVTEMVFNRDGGYRDLLTSSDTFVNDELARIYELDGTYSTETFEPVSLDPAQRRGIFTQVGFLAANATTRSPDPIHRGVYLAERIACVHIDAPPEDTPPPGVMAGLTNRQTIELHTEQPGSICAGCHAQIINPFGFPFESYDAIGMWQTTDNGQPIDTSGSPPVDGVPTPVADAVQLADALADSEWVHECYVRHWIEFTLGRHAAAEDQALVADLGERSRAGELSIKELIVSLVTSRAFLTRSIEEL